MNPNQLELEISEKMLLQDVHRTARVFTQIKTLGVKIVVGDFGAGYSSLSDLDVLPIDALNVSASLIKRLSGAREEQRLSSSVLEFGQSLSRQMFAKGVVSHEQMRFINEHSNLTFHGFYSNRPLQAAERYALKK